MKKNLYLLLLIPFFTLQSCVKDEEDVFDASAAERIANALKEYKVTLSAASNGWLLEYYPEKEHAVGGYNLICRFSEDGKVRVASEMPTENHMAGDTVVSEYELIADQGPVLTFNTYNELIHYFTEPHGSSDVDGLAGDYEFIVMSVTPDRFVLKGKRGGNKLVMTRLADQVDWQEYIGSVAAMEKTSFFGNYHFIVGSDTIGKAILDERTLNLTYGENKEVLSFVVTPTGIKLYEPFEYGSVKMENFSWDADKEAYVCTDNNSAAVMFAVFTPEGYRNYGDFIGTYTMYYSGSRQATVSISEKLNRKTLQVSGAVFPVPFELKYSMSTGNVEILVQKKLAALAGGNTLGIAMWDSNKGYVNFTDAGMMGVCEEIDGHLNIGFEDNGKWPGYYVDGFIFWKFNSEGSSAGSNGNQFYEVTFVKQ